MRLAGKILAPKAPQLLRTELMQHHCSRAVELVMSMGMSTRVTVICSHWDTLATPTDEIFSNKSFPFYF